MIKERLIVIHLLLINLHLASLIVVFDWWVYRSVTSQVLQLILIQLLQSLLVQILPLNTWQLFGASAAFDVGFASHSLFINLSEDLSNFKFFFNGNIEEAEGVSEEITFDLTIDLGVTVEGRGMVDFQKIGDRLVVTLLDSGIYDNVET